MKERTLIPLLSAVAAVALWLAPAALAKTGSVDSGFGNEGRAVAGVRLTDSASSVAPNLEAARGPEGRLYVASSGYPNSVVVAFSPDGSIARAFGTDGRVHISAPDGSAFKVGAIATDSTGRLLVAGTQAATLSQQFVVYRFMTSGALDPTFGTGGVATHEARILPGTQGAETFGATAEVTGLAVDSLGRIVLGGAGSTNNGIDHAASANVVRFNADGSLDTSFGGAGAVVYSAALLKSAGDLQLTAAGFPVLGGVSSVGKSEPGPGSPSVDRLTSDGIFDYGFGAAGTAAGAEAPLAIALGPSGATYALGPEGVTELDPSGTAKTAFAPGALAGLATKAALTDLAVTPDGGVVVSGFEVIGNRREETRRRVLVLARLDSKGHLVRSFGRGGVVRQGLGKGGSVAGQRVFLDGEGHVFVAGTLTSSAKPVIREALALFGYDLNR
jgi:uncharacterized delta-60 repeat protein